MKKVAIYCRVSSADQSTEMQKNDIFAFIKARGWEIYKIYEEKITGTTENRPQLNQLMKDAKNRYFDVVLCWKLDRFFRSLKGIVITLQEFSELGIEFVSIRDNLDLTTSSGRLMMHILGAFAEFEASIIRERVRAGISAAKSRGQKLGRPARIDSAVVKQLRDEGLSFSAIAKRLGVSKSAVHKISEKNRP